MNLKELQEQRGKLRAEAQAMLEKAENEKRSLSATETDAFNKIKDALKTTHEQIANRSMLADSDAAVAAIRGAKVDGEAGPMRVENRSGTKFVSGDKVDFRSLEVGSFDVGTIDFLELTKKFDDYSAIVSLVDPSRVIRTSHGRDMTVPVIAKGTGESRTEGQTGTTDSTNSFSESKLSVTRYGSKVIPITIEMLEDAEFDITGLVADLGFARCAAAFDAGQTSTITSGATAVAIDSPTAGLTVEDLIDAKMSGISRYARRNVKVSINSNSWYSLLTQLDTTNAPLYSSWRGVVADLLAPERVIINDSLSDDTALVGNFDEALFVRVKTPATVQLIDVSANKNAEVHMRAGVVVRNADAIAYVS